MFFSSLFCHLTSIWDERREIKGEWLSSLKRMWFGKHKNILILAVYHDLDKYLFFVPFSLEYVIPHNWTSWTSFRSHLARSMSNRSCCEDTSNSWCHKAFWPCHNLFPTAVKREGLKLCLCSPHGWYLSAATNTEHEDEWASPWRNWWGGHAPLMGIAHIQEYMRGKYLKKANILLISLPIMGYSWLLSEG